MYNAAMTMRVYGQYCGLARALEIVGERWAFLIVRDLLVGSKRFTDLRLGLPGIPTNVLTARLKELERGGVIRRRLLPRPAGSIIYELTPYGMELEEVVVHLGRWGAKSLGDPRCEETVTVDSMVMAMRSTFRPEAARGTHASYEFRFGDIVIHVRIDDAEVDVGAGPTPGGADLIVETGPAIKGLMTGEITPAEAISSGIVRLTGDPALLTRFAEIFRIDPMPQAASG
jgi:DNA-binding HxlR family transcriptional regulator